MHDGELLSLDATAQLERLEARSASARELLEASLKRADVVNGAINAVVARDVDRAMADARDVDERRARGERIGRLAGLPMTIKDTFDVAGLPASAGMRELLDRKTADADVVERVRREGAIVWGKTNTPVKAADFQTFNALYGTTRNPWDLSRTPGGSSGGSAAALAVRITALEIGADIGGSLRIPASFCGVYAHKPTYGLVSQRGLQPRGEADIDLAVVGPMARSARDLRLALSVMTERRFEAPQGVTSLKGLRIGLWLDEPHFVLDPEVRALVETFSRSLASAGANVRPITSPVSTEALMWNYGMLVLSLVAADFPVSFRVALELARPPALLAQALGAQPFSWAHGVIAYSARHRDWLRANESRARIRGAMTEFFKDHDALIAPVSPVAAFHHDHRWINFRKLSLGDGRSVEYTKMLDWIALATIGALPATALPIGLTRSGLPVGAQIIGPYGGDAITLAIAEAAEHETGGFRPPPEPFRATS